MIICLEFNSNWTRSAIDHTACLLTCSGRRYNQSVVMQHPSWTSHIRVAPHTRVPGPATPTLWPPRIIWAQRRYPTATAPVIGTRGLCPCSTLYHHCHRGPHHHCRRHLQLYLQRHLCRYHSTPAAPGGPCRPQPPLAHLLLTADLIKY